MGLDCRGCQFLPGSKDSEFLLFHILLVGGDLGQSSWALLHSESPRRGTAPASLALPFPCLLSPLPPPLHLLFQCNRSIEHSEKCEPFWSPPALTTHGYVKLGTEAKPPNPFSLVTYITIGFMDCVFCKSRGAMLL